MRAFLTVLLILISVCGYGADSEAPPRKTPKPDWEYVQDKLKKAKIKKSFIEDLEKLYVKKDFIKVLELNLLQYLDKTDHHGPQISKSAVRTIKSFISKNKKTFDKAEAEYGVDRRYIASLLWLESRYGKNKGKYQVASTYLHVLQADRPEVVAYLRKKSLDYLEKPSAKVRKEIGQRAEKKSKWAMDEIRALARMHKKDKDLLKGLKGSFAGAMGMPQFLPSSYVGYAKAAKPRKSADLNKADDAILSVANYLKKSGWKKGKEKTYAKALRRYNKNDDYVNTILELGGQIEGDESRRLSSED